MNESVELPGSKRRTVVVLVIVFVALVAAAVVWLRASRSQDNRAVQKEGQHEEKPAEESAAIELDEDAQRKIGLGLEEAQLKLISDTIEVTGVISPNQTRLAHIRPLSRGRVERVFVRVGDRVRAGSPLARYDNVELGELISAYRRETAELAKANADAEVTKRSVERAQRLVELGAVAKAEYERRDAEYKSAVSAIGVHKAEVAMIDQKLRRFGMTDADIQNIGTAGTSQHDRSHSDLRAPFDGIVIKSEVAEGELAEPEREVLTIADLSTVWVQGDVYQKDLASIRQGQEVRIVSSAYPGEFFTGKLTYLSDFLDPQSRTAKVRCEALNPKGRLKLEMFVTVQIPTGSRHEALMIPTAAVQQIDSQSVVFVKTGETEFQKREVRLGVESEGWVQVRDGLAAGDKVVTQAAFMLKSQLKKTEFEEEEH
ncbi:MAG TPA: efflux RND transporter periplasmic adaptor subunit [Blastocatellia bacterium]|nr:efflux RND transporter periplasmic adaptor subunit [Blastocatellia bacterium]